MTRPTTTLADRLLKAMAARGVKSRWDVESAAKVSKGYLTKLISHSEKEPARLERLARIADYLKVPFEWLAIDRGDMDGPSAGSKREPTSSTLEAVLTKHYYPPVVMIQVRAEFAFSLVDRAEELWKDRCDGLLLAYERSEEALRAARQNAYTRQGTAPTDAVDASPKREDSHPAPKPEKPVGRSRKVHAG